LVLAACSGKEAVKDDAPEQIKSSVPVPSFTISTSPRDIVRGQELFGEKGCTACHKVGGGKLVGPDLKGVTARRDETWIKRMILRPDVMIKEDEVAKKLFAQHLTPMPNQNVDPTRDLPPLLAYLKSVE
jgi:mono/diheme cytochrome c family protein